MNRRLQKGLLGAAFLAGAGLLGYELVSSEQVVRERDALALKYPLADDCAQKLENNAACSPQAFAQKKAKEAESAALTGKNGNKVGAGLLAMFGAGVSGVVLLLKHAEDIQRRAMNREQEQRRKRDEERRANNRKYGHQ
jgi:hypothetical protein